MKYMNQRIKYARSLMPSGTRIFAAADMTALLGQREKLAGEIKASREKLADICQKEGYKPEDGKALLGEIQDKVDRYNQLTAAIGDAQSQQLASLSKRQTSRAAGAMMATRDALGGLFKAMLTVGGTVSAEVKAALSLPTVDSGLAVGSGAVLLPRTVSAELIRDVVDEDAFLSAVTVTSIPGLEMPRVATTTEDDDDVADGTTAGEAALDADSVIFGRIPYRKNVKVPNGLVDCTNTDIEGYINTRHGEMLRSRLTGRILAASPKSATYNHMSVYHESNAVTAVTGTDMLDTIFAALAALPTRAEGVYKVAMTAAQYYALIKPLANGAQALFARPSKELVGFDAVICNGITKPIVGDLATIHVNFDAPIKYETDRHAALGVTDFVESTYYDIQIEQPGLLRIVDVTPALAAAETTGA